MESVEKRSKISSYDLSEKLCSLKQKWINQVCFPCSSLENAEDVAAVKATLEESGVVFITDAVTEDSIAHAKDRLCEEMWNMFQCNIPPGTKKPQTLEGWNSLRNGKNGFGNVSFAYMNKQFTDVKDTPFSLLNDEKVFLTHNTMWSQVNLELLLENPHTASVLLALTHVDGMVSVDSVKYASNPRPKPKNMTKQQLTVPHVDIYSGAIERIQALVVVEEKVKLGFVVGTHLLKDELSQVLGNKSLMTEQGYIGMQSNEALKQALKEGWLSAPSRSLVIWKSGVVHFEATSKPSAKGMKPFVFADWNDQPNQTRLRFAVGVHKPLNLSRQDLTCLAILGERGLIPDMYRGINAHTKLYPNMVNRKSTQYLVARKIEGKEKDLIEKILSEPRTEACKVWEEMSPLKKHLMGVSQDISCLPLSKKDKKMLKKAKKRSREEKKKKEKKKKKKKKKTEKRMGKNNK